MTQGVLVRLSAFSIGASWPFFVIGIGMIVGSRPIASRTVRDRRVNHYDLGLVGLRRLYTFNGVLTLAIAVLIGERVV